MILVTTSGCPHCEKAKEALRNAGFFFLISILDDPAEKEEFKKTILPYLELASEQDKKTFPKLMILNDLGKLRMVIPNSREIQLYAEVFSND